MSRHQEVAVWVDRVPYDSCALAADALGIDRSTLSRKHRTESHFLILDESDHLRTVDFIYPGPMPRAQIEPPPKPPRVHKNGEPLLWGHVTHRLGAYR